MPELPNTPEFNRVLLAYMESNDKYIALLESLLPDAYATYALPILYEAAENFTHALGTGIKPYLPEPLGPEEWALMGHLETAKRPQVT